MRRLTLLSSSAVVVALSALLACGGGAPGHADEPTVEDPQSGGLEGAPGEDPGSAPGEAPAEAAPGPKATICHIPPGNPANAHTITVGLPAVKAHLKHGDTTGPCGGGETDAGTGGGTDAGTGGETDAGTGGDVDAGTPQCAPVGATCGGGVSCCSNLSCGSEGYCEPIIG